MTSTRSAEEKYSSQAWAEFGALGAQPESAKTRPATAANLSMNQAYSESAQQTSLPVFEEEKRSFVLHIFKGTRDPEN
jgi:hypothetical protein